jgi:hypothetical protein
MQSNFQLKTHGKNPVHIDLQGVFDGASAFELVHTIARNCDPDKAVFIDTNQLTRAHAFGRLILAFHLPKEIPRSNIHFSGIKAGEIMPKGCRMLHKQKNRSETHSCSNNCPDCTFRPEI